MSRSIAPKLMTTDGSPDSISRKESMKEQGVVGVNGKVTFLARPTGVK